MMSDQTKDVVIFGDSHIGSLRMGLNSLLNNQEPAHPAASIEIRPLGPGGAYCTPFFRKNGSNIEIVDARLKKHVEKLPFDEKYRLYGFSGNLHTLRVIREIHWDSHAPSEIAEKREIPVSRSLLNEIFHDDQKYLLSFLDELSSMGISVFSIEAPRPFRHNPVFSGKSRQKVLLFIDQAYRKYITEELNKRNIPIVSVPSECVDDEGFTLDIYKHQKLGDPHHTSEAYGKLMMQKVCEYIRNAR